MTAIEIALVVIAALFTIAVILHLLGYDLKKIFKSLFSTGDKKGKKSKDKKPKIKKEKKSKVKNKETKEDKPEKRIEKMDKDGSFKKVEEKEEKTTISDGDEKVKGAPEKKERAFQITRKGVVKINKKAIERDSRTGAIIEPAIKPGQKVDEISVGGNRKGFENFDDLLEKLKDIGDPDSMDDETFNELFMPGDLGKLSEFNDDELDKLLNGETGDDFKSLESPAEGRIDRRLKHFTIDGTHLNFDKKYDNYPSRMPTLDMDHLVFTDRLTGRYENITMGDVTNRLKPSDEKVKEAEEQKKLEEDSDEEIFAKIMERRRRELGLENSSTHNSEHKNDEINMRDVVIADVIMNPKFKSNIKK